MGARKVPARLLVLVVAPFLLGVLGWEYWPRPSATLVLAPGFLEDRARGSGMDFSLRFPKSPPLSILETMGGGVALLDWDGDGDLDCVLIGPRAARAYRNEGSWRFTDVTDRVRLPQGGPWMGCAVGDFDNDGAPDLLLTGYHCLALLRNEVRSTGHFTDVTRGAGLDSSGWNTAAAFIDLDNDGLLDLYVARYVRFDAAAPQFCTERGVRTACGPETYGPEIGSFYHNRGDGTFEDRTAAAGFSVSHGKGLGVAVGDYDGDGRPDLFVANDVTPWDLYHNEDGARVSNAGEKSGTARRETGQPQSGMGADWGDYDGDGRPDLVVGTFTGERNDLFHNGGGGLFEERGMPCRIGIPTWMNVCFSAKFLDFDNDGYPDLLFTNGHVQESLGHSGPEGYRQMAQLFRNRGDGLFEDASFKAGRDLMTPAVGRGAAVGDLDNDGRLDIVMVDLDGPARLLQNHAPGGNWITFALEGTRSPRDGQGARVRIQTEVGAQAATCTTAGGFLAAHDRRVHFGLGKAREVSRAEVRWPSGRREAWFRLAAGEIRVLKEGSGQPF